MGLGTYQGSLPFCDDAVGGTVKTVKSGGAILLFGLKLVNTTAAAAYLQMFALPAASVTLGTTPPYLFFRLGSNESIFIGMNEPITFNGAGMSVAGTTTPTGNSAAIISVTALYGEP
jgi:hypothetical protein